ncbi:hypothetical protein [Caulobacter sp.]
MIAVLKFNLGGVGL